MKGSEPSQAATTVSSELGSRTNVQTIVLMVATAFGVYLCYRLVAPFMGALTWALALAVLFAPLQRWLESRLKWPSLAAIVAVLVVGLMVVVPAMFVGQRLVMQAVQGATTIEKKLQSDEWRHNLEKQPRLAPIVARIERQFDLPATATAFATWLNDTAGSIVRGSAYQIVAFGMTFYLLFFLLRDRHLALQSLRALSPLSRLEMDRLYARVGDTIHATIYGTLAVSALQGLLGGLMFWWLGLPAPLLWGMVMALLGLVPVLGAFVVWVPAAVFMALEGNWSDALILALWGILVVGTIDNLLRPMFVGDRLKLHSVLAFIAVVGGVLAFGTAGFILGPVILTVTLALLEIWVRRTREGEVAFVESHD